MYFLDFLNFVTLTTKSVLSFAVLNVRGRYSSRLREQLDIPSVAFHIPIQLLVAIRLNNIQSLIDSEASKSL